MSDRRVPTDRRKESDRRVHPRLKSTSTVRFLRARAAADEILAAELLDVSHTGVRIRLETPLVCGECILIEVRDGARHCFNLPAEVVWEENGTADERHAGCELRVELNRRQFTLLQKLVVGAAR